jgi:hypothetical protein
MTDESYPKYQYSVFMKNGRDEQLVIRADTFEELMELKKNIDLILAKRAEPVKTANQTFACSYRLEDGSICGAPAEYREGTSAKSGKPWKAVFCSLNKEHVRWLK